MKHKALVPLLYLLGATTLALAQERPFALKDGDRVVFYGDSITDQRLYTTFAETFVITRFPKLDVTFVHSGWGGDRVSGGGGGPIDERLERDVIAYKPTVMTIMLGMNDGSYQAFNDKIFDRYRTGYEHIVDSVKKALPGLKLTLIEPSPFDDVTQPPRFEGGYNKVLVRYSEYVMELAKREHCNVADLNGPVVAALVKAKATDAELAKKIVPDRVHPGPAGHLLMAGELVKSWNAPRTVTAVEIDAAGDRVVKAKAAKVSDLEVDGSVFWKQLDEALPMPVDLSDPVTALAINSSDFMQALDQQPLKVTGLTAAAYTLSIDGVPVAEFIARELADGVDLAAQPTPMAEQAAKVHRLTLEHNNLHFTRWRQIQVPLAHFNSDRIHRATLGLMDAFDDEEEAVVKRQRAAAQPREHRYALTPD